MTCSQLLSFTKREAVVRLSHQERVCWGSWKSRCMHLNQGEGHHFYNSFYGSFQGQSRPTISTFYEELRAWKHFSPIISIQSS